MHRAPPREASSAGAGLSLVCAQCAVPGDRLRSWEELQEEASRFPRPGPPVWPVPRRRVPVVFLSGSFSSSCPPFLLGRPPLPPSPINFQPKKTSVETIIVTKGKPRDRDVKSRAGASLLWGHLSPLTPHPCLPLSPAFLTLMTGWGLLGFFYLLCGF